MFMIKEKQIFISNLRNGCKMPIQGFVSNLWFDSLVHKYPIHFLFYTKGKSDYEVWRSKAKNKIIEKYQSSERALNLIKRL